MEREDETKREGGKGNRGMEGRKNKEKIEKE